LLHTLTKLIRREVKYLAVKTYPVPKVVLEANMLEANLAMLLAHQEPQVVQATVRKQQQAQQEQPV
jgi:hypothetical protein